MKLSFAIETERDAPAAENPRCRPSANFVTQVAATFLRLPQTRARRQREPEDVIKAYDLEIRPASKAEGNLVSRKV
jgi:hypothetical protein